MNLNFDLGKLWPWAAPEQESEYVVYEGSAGPEVSANVAIPSRKSKEELLRQLNKIQTVVKPRDLRNVNQTLASKSYQQVKIDNISVEPIEVERLEGFTPNLGRIDLAAKEYLIPRQMEMHRSRFAIGVAFAPGYSYRTMKFRSPVSHGVIANSGQSKIFRDKNDRAILNFYAGLEVYFHVNQRWTIQSGLYYSSMGEQLYVVPLETAEGQLPGGQTPSDAYNEYSPTYESPEKKGESSEKIPFNNYYGSLEIPVLVNYRIWKKQNLNVDAQVGLSYTYLNHVDALVYDYKSDTYFWIGDNKFDYFNRHNSNAYLGISFSQYITPNVEIFANPQMRYTLFSTFNSKYPVKQKQYSGGVRLGMKVNL